MKYTLPDYDPKLSPERNAEIKEWANRNFETMDKHKLQGDRLIEDDVDAKNFIIECDFDEDCVTDE